MAAKRTRTTNRGQFRLPNPKPEVRPCSCGASALWCQSYSGPKALDVVPISQLGEWMEIAAGMPTYRLTERSCQSRCLIEQRAGVRRPEVYRLHICGRPFPVEHMNLNQYAAAARDESRRSDAAHTPPF